MFSYDRDPMEQILFTKLGDAFRFGMMSEIDYGIDASDSSGLLDLSDFSEFSDFSEPSDSFEYHIYASVAYMYLNDFISDLVAKKVYRHLISAGNGVVKQRENIEEMCRELFGELLQKYHFADMEELTEILNRYTIPNWYFSFGLDVLEHSRTGIFLYEDHLYYIACNDGNNRFVKTDLERLDSELSLDEQREQTLLSCGYTEILGFDKKFRRVYLGSNKQKSFYHYYDMLSNDFVICSHQLVAIHDGIPYVITKDGYFAYVLGSSIHRIKPYHEYEKYEIRKDCFLVVPQNSQSTFFYPYCITFDGKVVQADIHDTRRYIWYYLKGIGFDRNHLASSIFPNQRMRKKEIMMPDDFSLNSIVESFRKQVSSNNLSTNKKFMILENITEIINGLVDSHYDATRLLFALFDVDRCLCKGKGTFPSEELYWRLKEVNACVQNQNKLQNCLKEEDYDTVKALLLGNMQYVEPDKRSVGYIGYFLFQNENLQIHAMDMKYGKVIGSLIVCDRAFSTVDGMVSYDCSSDVYYVTSEHSLSSENKLEIMKQFKLSDHICTFVVQPEE